MHNLHIVIARAESADEAMAEVETYIEGWGDEDNWRSIAGAVEENGTWHPGEPDSRYSGPCTLGELNQLLEEAVRTEPDAELDRTIALLAAKDYEGLCAGSKTEAYLRILRLREFVGRLHGVHNAGLLGREASEGGVKPLSVFDVEFLPWEYGEFGVTRMPEIDGAGTDNRYAVLVDMHS